MLDLMTTFSNLKYSKFLLVINLHENYHDKFTAFILTT